MFIKRFQCCCESNDNDEEGIVDDDIRYWTTKGHAEIVFRPMKRLCQDTLATSWYLYGGAIEVSERYDYVINARNFLWDGLFVRPSSLKIYYT